MSKIILTQKMFQELELAIQIGNGDNVLKIIKDLNKKDPLLAERLTEQSNDACMKEQEEQYEQSYNQSLNTQF